MDNFKRRISRINTTLYVYIFCIVFPIILLPLALSPLKELKCAYVIIFVAVYWCLEPIHMAVTALLPIVLFPLMGIVDSQDVCSNYMRETFMMFIGGLIIAMAVEHCNLHERIALKVLLSVGTEMKWLMLGFMMTSMFLSMWISNTATTAMMVPIVEAVVEEISLSSDHESNIALHDLQEAESGPPRNKSKNGVNANGPKIAIKRSMSAEECTSVKIAFLLSVCYSANIGGTGTLTGTGPNIVFKGMLEELYPESNEISFATWMMYNVPGMVFCVIVAWIYLYVIYFKCSKETHQLESKDSIRRIITERYKALGSISFHEGTVIVLFATLVLLWVFRDPKFIVGWATAIGSGTKIGDSVPAIAISALLFILPSDPKHFTTSGRVLDWKTAQSKLPWGVVLLIGGGFALADGAQKSGLSASLGKALTSLSVLPPPAITAIVCFMTAMLTEVMTNTTTATILLPVFGEMAISMGVNPLFFMLPVTVTCSYAFMLPVATPPNAVAFDSGHMKVSQMAKPGIVMNIVCCSVQLLMVNTLGVAMFNLNQFPNWVNKTMAGQSLFNASSNSFTFDNSTNLSINV